MPPQGRSHRVISNAIYNLIPQVWFLGLTVFTTPFVLHRLGVEAYGILSIVTIVAGYLAFLDFGLNLAIIKFIAGHDARGESGEINRVVQTSLSVFLLIGGVAVMALATLSGTLAQIMSVPDSIRSDAVAALRLGALGFGINLVMGVFSAIPRALQRFDIVNLQNLIIGTLQVGVTVMLLAAGFGLMSLIIWSCALSGLSLITQVVIAKRLLPSLRLSPSFDAKKFRELFRFSSFVMASNFTGVASAHSEKLLLGGLAPLAQVTYYSVPFNLVSRVLMVIPSNLFNVLFPAFASMGATNSQEAINAAYKRAFRMIFVAVAPISILLIVYGSDLLRVWLGDEMGQHGGPVLAILAAAILINAPAWVCVTVGQSLGRPALVTVAQIVHLTMLLLFGLLLVPLYGAVGAALAWLAGNLFGIPVLIFLINRQVLSLHSTVMLKDTLFRPGVTALLTLVLAFALKPLVNGAVSLTAIGLLVAFFYATLSYLIAFEDKDRELIKGFLTARHTALKGALKVAKGQA